MIEAVDLPRLCRVARACWRPLRPSPPAWYGPTGVVLSLTRDGAHAGSVIVTTASHDGEEWVHASIAWDDHMPDYGDLVSLRDAVFGPRRECYQVFPPASRHVSIHNFALHLWGRADGASVLPAFGAEGTI